MTTAIPIMAHPKFRWLAWSVLMSRPAIPMAKTCSRRFVAPVMRSDPERSETATYLLWVAHNFERIADRTVNVGERAAFIATGIFISYE